jgi:SAM-dependent methyltransferase
MNWNPLCPACGAGGTSPWHEKNGYGIFRCGDCGTGFLDREALDLDPKVLYGRAYYAGDGKTTYLDYAGERENLRRAYRRILGWIEKEAGAPGRLLEAGCAMGFFLDAARERGWATRGFEISEFAASVAARKPDLGVTCADFTSPGVEVEPGSFDAAVALDTIEHVRAPEILLAKMHLALREGGICLVSTGDITSLHASIAGRRWRLIQPPEHIYYFSRRGLRSLMKRQGFSPEAVKYPWKHYSAAALAGFFGIRLPRSLGRIPIPVNTLDIMYILARKGALCEVLPKLSNHRGAPYNMESE